MVLREAQLIMLDILKDVDRICKKYDIEYYLSDGTLLGAVRHKGFIPWDDDLDISMTRENYNKFFKIASNELKSEYFVQTFDTEKEYSISGCPMKIRHLNSRYKEIKRNHVKYKEGIFIDVFPMDRIPSKKYLMKIQKLIGEIFFRLKDTYDDDTKVKKSIKFLFKPISYKFFRSILRSTLWINKKYGTDVYTYGVDTYFYGEFTYQEKNLFPLKEIEFEGYKFLAPYNPNVILTELYGDYMKLPPVEQRYAHATHIEIFERKTNEE